MSKNFFPPQRDGEGFEIYVASMGKSADDKAENILPLVEDSLKICRGDILELGAGGGDLSLRLQAIAKKNNVGFTALDADPRMIGVLKNKLISGPSLNIVLANALDFELGRQFSVIVCSSLLHEIFSANGDINDIRRVLKNIHRHLLPGGSLVIRDGIKPDGEADVILLKPLKPEIGEKLRKFLSTFRYRKEEPRFVNIGGKTFVAMSRELYYEFAVKYQYPEVNWPFEMAEQFGFWQEREARALLKATGFEITHLKRYLLAYFKELFSKDFQLFCRRRGKLAKIEYFDTHMVIAARRP